MKGWKQIALTVGIAILYTIFIVLVIDFIYPRPEYPIYDDYVTVSVEDEKYEQQVKAYEEAKKPAAIYAKNFFVICMIVGIVSITLGAFLIPPNIPSIGAGLMYGGILMLIIGTVQYFGEMGKLLRIIVTGIALTILIWIGAKKLSGKEK